MSRTYCHTHSKYDCQTCADEILSLGIQGDKDRIAALERELERLRKDAERYRWIRDPKSPADKVILFNRGAKGKGVFAFIALDECIDAAIAQEGE